MRIRVTVDRFLNTLILVFTYKEVVFCLACCTVCNNLTLFSLLSFTTIWHSPPPPTSFFVLSSLFLSCSAQRPHGGASHLFCFVFSSVSWTFHHRSSVLSPFLPPLSVSLSVMAYQDGFYGAADLYVSIYISPLYCLTPVFPLLLVGFQV